MKKSFKLSVIITLTNGFMVCENFGDMHGLVEWLAGHPVWSHELANKNLIDSVKEKVFTQHSVLREVEDLKLTNEDKSSKSATLSAINKYLEPYIAKFGDTLEIDGMIDGDVLGGSIFSVIRPK